MAALRLFLVSLIAPFIAVVGAYLVLRAKAPYWPPEGAPPFPDLLWVSTGLILLVSVFTQWALQGVKGDREIATRWGTLLATLCAYGFMVTQSWAWKDLFALHVDAADELRTFTNTFYILTGLHAIHVVGGLLLTTTVCWNAFKRKYWSYHYPGIRYNAMVWHFLDAIWIFLFLVLWLGNSN